MIEIPCAPSPFVFKPIYHLLKKSDWELEELDDKLILNFINPLKKEYKIFKKESHLTDGQTKEYQLRFLGNREIDKKLMHIARKLRGKLLGKEVRFLFSCHFKPSDKFLQFINYMELFSDSTTTINMSYQNRFLKPAFEENEIRRIENLYFASEMVRIQNAELIFEASRDCSNAEDYQSAINLLISIRDLDLEKALNLDIISHLAICHRAAGEFMQSTFYNQIALEKGNLNQRVRAHYSLAMLNIRHYPLKFRNLEKGGQYLQDIYQELLSENYSTEKKEFDLVFNRNGYALVEYRNGNLDEATQLVENGIERLGKISTAYAIFHQSVLYYNLFQCYAAKNNFSKAEATLQQLLKIDEKYFAYYLHLVNFYLRHSKFDEALGKLCEGIKVAPNFFRFYYLIGLIKYQHEEFESAIEAFEKALSLNPLDVRSLAYLTSIFNMQSRYKKVLDLTNYFNFRQNNHSQGEIILNNKIIALLNTEHSFETIASLINKASELRPESVVIENLRNVILKQFHNELVHSEH